MTVEFEVLLRTFENGQPAYDRHAQMRVGNFAPPIELSQRMTEDFARDYHKISNPTPADLTNVMCNELFHLMREEKPGDHQRNAFVSGCILRLCALPEDAQHFRGIGRHPAAGERIYLTINRQALGEDRYAHNCSITTTPPPPAP